jgi:hypothetical protein
MSVGSLAIARAMARRLLGLVADAEEIEEIAGASFGCPPFHADDQCRHDDVLEHRHALEQVEELEHDADVLAPHQRQTVLVELREILTRDEHLAFVGSVEARDDVEHGRLAATGRAHHRDELAFGDGEVGSPQCSDRRQLLFERAVHALGFDDEVGHFILLFR